MQTTGQEYDHIDFYDGEDTVRHYLKDNVAREDIDDINQRMAHNIKDGAGQGSIIENCLEDGDSGVRANTASGQYSHAEGQGTYTSGQAAHAEGVSSRAMGKAAHAEGESSTASAQSAHAEGMSTNADNEAAHAEGRGTTASGWCSHAEGSGTTASGENAHTQGFSTKASGMNASAAGFETNATRRSQHVFGEYNIPEEGPTTARGVYVEIVGNGIVGGEKSNARTLDWSGNEELAGHLTIEKGGENEAVITGERWREIPHHICDGTGVRSIISNLIVPSGTYINTASGDYSNAEGFNTKAAGNYSHAEGFSTDAMGDSSHTEGNGTQATALCSHAEGQLTKAYGANSHASGWQTVAYGANSFVCGVGTIASHARQFVFGQYNVTDPSELSASSNGMYIEIVGNGQNTTLRSNARTLDWDGNESLAGGLTLGAGSSDETSITPAELGLMKSDVSSMKQIINNVPRNSLDGTGRGAVVIASDSPSRASGEYAVAESSGNASGRNSHAEGNGTLAQGLYSHAEGYNTTAGGVGTHAQGYSAVANGEYSHAEGYGTIASGKYQHVGGKWNLPDSDNAEIIGNGAANNRSNARTLDWAGNEVLAGSLTTGGDVIANGISLADIAAQSIDSEKLLQSYNLVAFKDISTKFIASDTIHSGEYFSVGQHILQATTDIPMMGTAIRGTNCTSIDISSILNEMVNSDKLFNDYRLIEYSDIPNKFVAGDTIHSGEYFSVGQYIFKATADIPMLGTARPGTNCVLANIGSILNDIISRLN